MPDLQFALARFPGRSSQVAVPSSDGDY